MSVWKRNVGIVLFVVSGFGLSGCMLSPDAPAGQDPEGGEVESASSAIIYEEEMMEGGGGGTYYPPSCPSGLMDVSNTTSGTWNTTTLGQGQPGRSYSGETVTLYIHGSTLPGSMTSTWGCNLTSGMWFHGTTPCVLGPAPRFLCWNNMEAPWTTNNSTRIKAQLDHWCRAGQNKPCRIICNSAGCALTLNYLTKEPTRWQVLAVYTQAGVLGGSWVADVGGALLKFFKVVNYLVGKVGSSNPVGLALKALFSLAVNWVDNLYESRYKYLSTNSITNQFWPVAPGASTYIFGTNRSATDGIGLVKTQKCKWWAVWCHAWNIVVKVVNAVIKGLNAAYYAMTNGFHDGLVSYYSTLGYKSKHTRYDRGTSNPAIYRWTGFYLLGSTTSHDYFKHMDREMMPTFYNRVAALSVSTVVQEKETSSGDCGYSSDAYCQSYQDTLTSLKYNSDSQHNYASTLGYQSYLEYNTRTQVNSYAASVGDTTNYGAQSTTTTLSGGY